MAQLYRHIGEKYFEAEILRRYKWAYEQPWVRSRLRYFSDGRLSWQRIVSSSTVCSDSQYFEELYNYCTTEQAWHLCDPDAERVFQALRTAGVKLTIALNLAKLLEHGCGCTTRVRILRSDLSRCKF